MTPTGRLPVPPFDAGAVRGIVFDLDGTLIDSYQAIAGSLNHARAHYGMAPLDVDTVRAAVGHGLEHLIADWIGPDRIEDGVRLFREHYARVCGSQTRVIDGVPAALARLERAGLRMAIASNKPARFTDAILRQLGLAAHFDDVTGPDRAGCTKPEPGMIRGCLERLGLSAPESLYVGDMVLDAESAARAGLAVVLVATGSSSAQALGATGQLVLSSLGVLADRLEAAR